MNYICEITTPSKLFGEQVEVTEKDALLCAESFGKRENGERVRVVDAWTGKTLSEVVFDGEKYAKPAKKRVTARKRAAKVDACEQISLF